jgi:penicillin-binding protein 1A
VVERVRTADGKVLYTREAAQLGRVIEPEYVAMMNRMMRETLVSGTARRADVQGWSAAGKTGTSQDFRDAWFVGYTSHLVTGVWLGNDDSSPTKKATGSGLPVDIWSRFMRSAHQGVPMATLPASDDGVRGGPPNLIARPSAPVEQARAHSAQRKGLDGWFIDQLFSRR